MKHKRSNQVTFDIISGSENWLSANIVNRGDSVDLKYCIRDRQDQEYFLKISEMALYERRKQEFEHLVYLYDNYACVPRPLDFGICLDGKHCYTLSQWAHGETVARLMKMDAEGRFGIGNPEHEKYQAGVNFGVVMKQIHTPLTFWNQTADAKLLSLTADQALQTAVNELTSQADANLFDFIQVDLAALVRERAVHLPPCPPCLLHGDVKMDHAIVTPLHGLLMTDFADWSYGHPYAELANMLIDFRMVNINFLTGVLDGYLTHMISSGQLFSLSFYVALSLLERLTECEVSARKQTKKLVKRIMSDFEGFHSTIPTWYKPHS